MAKRIDKSDQEWENELTPEQFHVCRRGGTEIPFTGDYHDCHASGVYRCVCCGAELFASAAKFDSGTGWPSFVEPVSETQIAPHADDSLGMRRTEVRCRACDAHLGHVFEDGPTPTRLRYCINSAALRLDETD